MKSDRQTTCHKMTTNRRPEIANAHIKFYNKKPVSAHDANRSLSSTLFSEHTLTCAHKATTQLNYKKKTIYSRSNCSTVHTPNLAMLSIIALIEKNFKRLQMMQYFLQFNIIFCKTVDT